MSFLYLVPPAWEVNALAAEVGLTKSQLDRYVRAMKNVTLKKFVSILAVDGTTTLEKGPTIFLQFFLGEGEDIRSVSSYWCIQGSVGPGWRK